MEFLIIGVALVVIVAIAVEYFMGIVQVQKQAREAFVFFPG